LPRPDFKIKTAELKASNSMMRSNSKVLAVIPAYNEESRIGPVIHGASQYLPVLVVDDGSRDKTAGFAEAAGAMVLTLTPNQGKGAALRAGFRKALEDGFEAVVTLDADGQHDPAEIPGFLQVYEEQKADLVIGKRDFKDMPPIRRLANTLGEATFSWAIGQPVPDNQSGYRLLSRRMMLAIAEGTESGFEFELEMIVICVRNSFTLAWVPIKTIYAGESSHIDPVHHLTNFLRMAWKTRRASKSN
jgi:glycosyltransferase involved in cell wall biosynthesis